MNKQFTRPLATLTNRKTELQIFDMPAKLGRNNNAVDIYYFHESVSREHCIFECINGRYTVMDLGSTVGTFIEGVKLEMHVPYNVNDGAKIKIGKVKFTFHADYDELAARNQARNQAPVFPNDMSPLPRPRSGYPTGPTGGLGNPVHDRPNNGTRVVTISAKELSAFEYNEEEVLFIDCGIKAQDKPVSYTNRIEKADIEDALKESENDVDELVAVSVPTDDKKATQKMDLSDLEEDTGEMPEDEGSSVTEETIDNEGVPQSEKSVYVTWIDDETGETKKVIINRFPFYIGRKSTENDYAIAIRGFSRNHMHFEKDNGEFFICDDGSTNGTKLNGNRIPKCERVRIDAGDRMRIAGVTFLIDIK